MEPLTSVADANALQVEPDWKESNSQLPGKKAIRLIA